MKIRNGFVSNSSAASFCIYGWTEDVFKDRPDLLPTEEQVSMSNYRHVSYILEDLLKTIPHGLSIIENNSPNNDFVIGVGNSSTDIDHNMGEGEYWEDYISDEPTQKEMRELEKVAEKLKLPLPKMYSATWRDG